MGPLSLPPCLPLQRLKEEVTQLKRSLQRAETEAKVLWEEMRGQEAKGDAAHVQERVLLRQEVSVGVGEEGGRGCGVGSPSCSPPCAGRGAEQAAHPCSSCRWTSCACCCWRRRMRRWWCRGITWSRYGVGRGGDALVLPLLRAVSLRPPPIAGARVGAEAQPSTEDAAEPGGAAGEGEGGEVVPAAFLPPLWELQQHLRSPHPAPIFPGPAGPPRAAPGAPCPPAARGVEAKQRESSGSSVTHSAETFLCLTPSLFIE